MNGPLREIPGGGRNAGAERPHPRYIGGASKRRNIPNAVGTPSAEHPNVQDRFIQDVLLGVLEPIFEPKSLWRCSPPPLYILC